jgi:hypothetical protein
MIQRNWAGRLGSIAMVAVFAGTFLVPALAEEAVLKKGTDVHLVFDSHLSSKTATPGETVKFHVETPVQLDGKTVIAAGTPVTGTVQKVNKRGRYGVNATVQMKLSPIRTVDGKKIALEPKQKGQVVNASRTGAAAGATAAGAVVLGPIGLAAGYFIVGKTVNAKPGDKTTVEIAKDTPVNVH